MALSTLSRQYNVSCSVKLITSHTRIAYVGYKVPPPLSKCHTSLVKPVWRDYFYQTDYCYTNRLINARRPSGKSSVKLPNHVFTPTFLSALYDKLLHIEPVLYIFRLRTCRNYSKQLPHWTGLRLSNCNSCCSSCNCNWHWTWSTHREGER